MELPTWLAAPYAVAILGAVMPDRMDELVRVQEAARSGRMPWPEQARNMEAFHLATEMDQANLHELRNIGRGMVAADKASAERARRRRKRELRAALGLTGTDTRRPPPHAVRDPAGGTRDARPAPRARPRVLGRDEAAVTRAQPPELPEHKPVAEMTPEERAEYAKELRRIVRRELAELNPAPAGEEAAPGPSQAA
jgi:hypothetical protein